MKIKLMSFSGVMLHDVNKSPAFPAPCGLATCVRNASVWKPATMCWAQRPSGFSKFCP